MVLLLFRIFQLYLEAQTESTVCAIVNILIGVRARSPPPTLNENLTHIITIVSSIVTICNDNLPLSSAHQGHVILGELCKHADKLSEVRGMPEVTKESRRIIAESSLGVVITTKDLMKL